MMQLTKEELNKLQECDGKHESLDTIFNCDSCSVLLKADNKIDVEYIDTPIQYIKFIKG